MKKFLKIKRIIPLLLVVLIVTAISLIVIKNHNKPYIEKVLNTRAYKYLPNEAKDFIRLKYELTGKLVLTEKNKEENTPYLNPGYISYLELSDKEKEKVNIIPDTYIVDYIRPNKVEGSNFAERYDLMDLNYTTPYYDQGNLNVCWAFASIEQAEGLLMKMKHESYSQSTERFSVRQMDYATSQDGIKNYQNENNFSRQLTEGGNFFTSSFIMSYGLSLINDNTMPYNQNKEKKALNEVLNYDNSKYELNSSISMPTLVDNASDSVIEEYLDLVKQYVIDYRGAYVGTGSPNGNCGFQNTDGTYAIVDDGVCVGNLGHAMQIVGWDDNYQYSYCDYYGNHTNVSSNGTCSSGTKKTGKGAWILRNSWGSSTAYKKVYLAYTPIKMNINFTTSLSSASSKNWDNLYHKNPWDDSTITNTSDTVTYQKKINTKEQVKAVKFFSASINSEYTISIRSANSNYNDIKTFSVTLPGIYKIDLSDQNIVIDDDSFTVTITSTNSSYLYTNSISVFTSNLNKEEAIKTGTITANNILETTDDGIKYLVYSDTKNIDSNEIVSYSLKKNNTSYNNYLISTEDNVVAENNINAVLEISKSIPSGDYDLNVSHGSNSYTTTISIPNMSSLSGNGTEEDPYLIHNEGELKKIVYDMEASYKIVNDITLTEEWTPLGSFTKPFKGGLDGDNHTINNLIIDTENNNSSGLFAYMKNQYYYEYYDNSGYITSSNTKQSYIKNLKINNPSVTGQKDTGILVGTLLFDYSDKPDSARNINDSKVVIDSISITGGTSTSTNGDAGMLIGKVDITPLAYTTPRLILNNIYTSTTVDGYHSAGLIGFINDSYISGSGIKIKTEISNFESTGKIVIPANKDHTGDDFYSPVVGGLYGNAEIKLRNYLINTIFTNSIYNYYFLRYNDYFFLGSYIEDSTSSFKQDVADGYYISTTANDLFTKNATQVKTLSLYNGWNNFSTYWKQDTDRIPQLKISTLEYTDINDITINKYDDISLLDNIIGENNIQYITYEEVSNDDLIELYYAYSAENNAYDDIRINAIQKGAATLHIVNNYDGLEKNIKVTVDSPKVSNPTVSYYCNDGTNESVDQTITAKQAFSVMTNSFNRPGYRFVNWNTKKDGSGTTYLEDDVIINGIDENLRLYAQWEEIDYTIKYHSNGGTGSMDDNTNVHITPNHIYRTRKNTFSREHYTFVGWNTKADGTGVSFANEAGLTTTDIPVFVNDTLNLYAQWSNIKFTLSFDANGGTGTMNSLEINSGLEATIPENKYTKTGYKFTGWNTQRDGNGTSYSDEENITLQDNITLYAMWTPITYTIRFNSNDANHLEEIQTFTYDQSEPLRENTFIREDYIFTGWNTKQDGTGTSYTDCQEILNITDKDNDFIELFAQWREKIEYEIIDYQVDEEARIISRIPAGTTIDEYKSKINVGLEYTVIVDTKTVNGKQVIYTGSKTKIYKNNNLAVAYENAVIGDPSGDGVINSMDLLKIVRYLKKLDSFTNYQYAAADCNNDSTINSMDLLKIVRYLKGLGSI